ncbi:MAG: SIS domain-containing protein, partial [Treponema sp.]|nr:SIS domain-containing protein [Treponema sp.]
MDYLDQLIERYPALLACREEIAKAFGIMKAGFEAGGYLLAAGNGGSSADSAHIVGELMKGFVKRRPLDSGFVEKLKEAAGENPEYQDYPAKNIQQGLPAIDLSSHGALITACINDIGGDIIYAQQVCGYGRKGDVFLGISTSGNEKNILYAMVAARAKGMKTIALAGGSGGAIKDHADAAIIVPEKETYKVQELHLPVYHALCLM